MSLAVGQACKADGLPSVQAGPHGATSLHAALTPSLIRLSILVPGMAAHPWASGLPLHLVTVKEGG